MEHSPNHFARWLAPQRVRDMVPPGAGRLRSSSLRWVGSQAECKSCRESCRLSCIVAMLPVRSVCEKLCDIFSATVLPLLPILHLPSFAADFDAFWKDAAPSRSHRVDAGPFLRAKPGFVCLLTSVLFAALVSAPPGRVSAIPGGDRLDMLDMYGVSVLAARITGFPRQPSWYTLSAYIISQSQFVREEESADTQDFVNTAFRVALGMGLHRDLTQAGFDFAEAETRRRLWWYILHLDVMLAASSGMSPLLIDEKMATTSTILPYYYDKDLQGQVDLRYFVATQRYELSREYRTILNLHFEDELQTANQYRAVADHYRSVADRVRESAQQFLSHSTSPSSETHLASPSFGERWSPGLEHSVHDIATFAAWSTILIHSMRHKGYCILYHPIFRDATLASDEGLVSSAIEHAQAYLQLFLRLCEDPVAEPFRWMYPGTYQPLQVIAVLLADMLKNPSSRRAEQSRGLIDAAFKLYQVDQGIVGKSTEEHSRRLLSSSGAAAWAFLSHTRRRALEAVGQDPHMTFPSQQASSNVCICGEQIYRDRSSRDQILEGSERSVDERPSSDDDGVFTAENAATMFDWDAWEASL